MVIIEHESSPDGHPDHAPAEAWDAIAAGYAEHVAPGEQRVSALALDLVGLREDESFLDVAAGPGGLGLAAARRGATVLATDWSPAMLAQFEAAVRSEGLANASGRVMDAHALALEHDSFDVTGSQFGVMLVPDQAVALQEMVRVTKPGGRVLLIAYGSPAEFDALQLFVAALQTVVPDFEGLPDPPPLEFQVSDPAVLRARLVAAGLSGVQVITTEQERIEVSTGQQAWDWMLYSNPITGMIIEDVGERRSGEDPRGARRADPRPRGHRGGRRPHRAAQHRLGPETRRSVTASVLVVGGGIAGRAVARVLARQGLACTVLERSRSIARGMGVNLPGNAVRALGEVGVHAEALVGGMPVQRREYRNARGRLLFAIDEHRFWRGVDPSVCLRHGDLLAALDFSDGVRVEQACAVGARSTSSGVEVEVEGAPLPRRVDFLIGADGVGSAVREALAVDGRRSSAMTGSSWRFVAANPGADCWTAWSGADHTFLLIPVEEGLVYGYAARTRGGDVGADRSWLVQAATGFPAVVRDAVARALDGGELHHAAVDEVRLTHWHHGRLVLIGDAAHATGPVWAQGVAMALEDAIVLGGLLASTPTDGWASVGAEFERLRRPRVEHVQASTARMSRLAAMPGVLRDLLAPVLGPRNYRRAYGPLRAPLAS